MSHARTLSPGTATTVIRAEDIHYRPSRRGDENAIVATLNAAYRTSWGTVEKWRFKHGDRPGYNPETIFLAEHDGHVVGCLHTMVRPIRFAGGTIRQSFDGDLGVDPKLRGALIPERLYEVSTVAHYRKGVELRGGNTQKALWEHFYRPRIGYVSGFDRSRAFKKLLSAKPIREKLDRLFAARPGGGSGEPGPIVEFRVEGVEPIRYRLAAGGARFTDDRSSTTALVIHVRQRFFEHSGSRGGRLKMILSGAVRVSGAIGIMPVLMNAILRARKRRSGDGAT